ncbi:hypothetical protein JTE90_004111 [Oedothorax gibbosus]|uniref:DNA polymerase delta subunit 2 n=1 Tax=Oedothorax gibbosus TaxID=931172 RepID=A0AAV6V240_9ARAC|nr:hypothetical protein JTE90_004111 [Oedothorax gibbosus]
MVPESNVSVNSICYKRPSSTYVNNSKKYLIPERTFERQYASLYASRLRITTDLLLCQIRRKWGPAANFKRLCDVEGDETAVVVGTIFKHMELHPSILKEISEEQNLIPQPVTNVFTTEDDYLILEDNLQRVVICGNIDPHAHVTGVNIALKGHTDESGKFFVDDFCYPYAHDPDPLPSLTEDKYVLLVSGLTVGNASAAFPLQMLIDLIKGDLGEEKDLQKFSRLVRVIIAGNSINHDEAELFKGRFLARKTRPATIDNVKELDNFISQIVETVDVDLMPGEFDPSNHLLPQQPLHPCMFPKSAAFSTFHVVTNPYDSTIDGVKFFGSSGQNIKDISSFSKLRSPTDVLEKTLDWCHMIPTAPDTLNCYPYFDEDPFIISKYPNVYFSGNASKMEYRFNDTKKVLMVAIPQFKDTFSALMLNLRTLEVEPIVVCDEVC